MHLHSIALLAALAATLPDDVSWPAFRGTSGRGVATGHATPLRWDVPTGKNVAWKTEVPGLGHSSPVVWGDRIYLTSAVRSAGEAELSSLFGSPGYGSGDSVEDEGPQDFIVMSLSKTTGEVLWSVVAHSGVPKVKRHPKSTHANSTPACFEGGVVAFFGSEGLYCYDDAGELRWKRDLGVLNAGAPGMAQYEWGFASSPVIHGDRVIVQCDVQGESFLAALDLATGADVWRTPRDEDPTWCTPAVAVLSERSQIIANGYKRVGGYDLATGEAVWWLSGGGDVPVPMPVVEGDMVVLTSAHGRSRPLTAMLLDGEGELSRDPAACDHVAWNHPSGGVYMQTPLILDGVVYACSDAGILGAYDLITGDRLYRERLGAGTGGFSASAVAADGKVYFTGEAGDVHVVRAGREFEVLASNDLGETCLATPAISEGVLYFRTRSQLVAIEDGGE